jgi:osmoprotectant transport system permease protein
MTTGSKLWIVIAVVVLAAAGFLAPRFFQERDDDALTAGFNSEFLVRPDGYPGLIETYGLEFASPPRHMDSGLMYKAVADGAVDVICGFATDGRIPAYDLKMLKDDRGFFPPYYAAPLVRRDTLREHPAIREVLDRLAGEISNADMQRLNYEVDEKHRRAADVAREFLESAGLVEAGAEAGDGAAGSVRIGGKNFTEQEILGEIVAILIEHHTDLDVERKLNLGGTMICFNALDAGDLDLYVEYTGTGLVSILDRKVIPDPEKAYETVQQAFDEKYDLAWLEPLGFNNTYALTMRKDQARALGIETISDLADHLNP